MNWSLRCLLPTISKSSPPGVQIRQITKPSQESGFAELVALHIEFEKAEFSLEEITPGLLDAQIAAGRCEVFGAFEQGR